MLINQNNQLKILLTLLQAQKISIPDLLDDHKKGEKSTRSSNALTSTTTTFTPTANAQTSTPSTTALATSTVVNTSISSSINPANSTILPLVSTEQVPTTEGEPPTKGEQLALVPKSKATPAKKKKQPPKKKIKTIQVKSIRCQGEPSSINEFWPCIIHSPSPQKPHGKNRFVEDFPMPKSDKSKLLGLAIHMGKFVKRWDETEEEKKEREKAEKERAEQEAKDLVEGKPVKSKLIVGKLDQDSFGDLSLPTLQGTMKLSVCLLDTPCMLRPKKNRKESEAPL